MLEIISGLLITPNTICVKIAVILYCLKNNNKKKVCICSRSMWVFPPHIFDPWLVDFRDLNPTDREAQLRFHLPEPSSPSLLSFLLLL
jgi:hypothetical protein